MTDFEHQAGLMDEGPAENCTEQITMDKDISASDASTEVDGCHQQEICDPLEVSGCETSPLRDTLTPTVDIPEYIPHFSEETVQKLAHGVETRCAPRMEKAASTLAEVIESQRILIETVIQENSKFQESEALKEVTKTMEKAKQYHHKLLHIKRDMLLLHEKSAKLKKRALKLQQQKQKELLQQEQERERQEERERQLMAQPAKSKSGPKS